MPIEIMKGKQEVFENCLKINSYFLLFLIFHTKINI